MAPGTVVHIVRHAQGFHQLPLAHPNTDIRDPELSPHGVMQCEHLRDTFPRHAAVELLAASPMRRALQTALCAFAPVRARGVPLLPLPDAQEATAAPSDTGSDVGTLRAEFGDAVELDGLEADWYVKAGGRGADRASLEARARRLRRWLRSRPEREIVLVTHGYFAHYLTGNMSFKDAEDAEGEQTGEWWTNVRWRSFNISDDDDAHLEETAESLRRTAAGEAPEHPPEEWKGQR